MKTEQFHVKNQFVSRDDNGNRYFQSYDSVICRIDRTGTVTLDSYYWNHSKTTSKYRNLFLGENIEVTRNKIDAGVYKLADLNNN